MKNIDFEKLISVQGFDSGTAEILGQYYIKGKWIDIGMGFFLIVFVLFFMSLINHR